MNGRILESIEEYTKWITMAGQIFFLLAIPLGIWNAVATHEYTQIIASAFGGFVGALGWSWIMKNWIEMMHRQLGTNYDVHSVYYGHPKRQVISGKSVLDVGRMRERVLEWIKEYKKRITIVGQIFFLLDIPPGIWTAITTHEYSQITESVFVGIVGTLLWGWIVKKWTKMM